MEISVLFSFAILIFGSGIKVNCLVDGIKSDGIMKQNENADRVSLFESSGSPVPYEAEPMYAKISPFCYNNLIKRSSIDRNTGRRQTGIIYGDGKPIGILQPYEESFKFMPIKEEKVYSVDGGRSDLDQQEPYLNLMYPLARFARSEDALKMAEHEAARAEFLEKHYPSMLVDFKIRDKLHSNRGKSTHQDIKKVAQKSNDIRKLEQKRDLKVSEEDRKAKKCVSKPVHKRENNLSFSRANKPMTQKREAEKPLKREEENAQQHETENPRKRESTSSQNSETKLSSKFKERHIESQKLENARENNSKKKRANTLTDSQFHRLKNAVSKRNSKESADVIENDLRGLLNDMGLIEDDLEENAEEMGNAPVAVNEDDDSEESFDNAALSKKIESTMEQKMDDYRIPERKKRMQVNSIANKDAQISNGLGDSYAEAEEHVEKRSNSEALKDKKRVIDVNFITKNHRDDKLLRALNSEPGENCSRASDIPNKRQATIAEVSDRKDQKKSIEDKKVEFIIPKAAMSTTETYAQYEERVAREIKNKIQQLKEEVKKELGALEEDNDEEDEDEESVGEPQRKKRFVANTLMDEEANNIDPNSNADNTELLPHVRRRRMLSTDTLDSYLDQNKEPVNSDQESNSGEVNQESSSMFHKGKVEVESQNARLEDDNREEESLSNQNKFMEEEALKYLNAYKENRFAYKDNRFDFDNDYPNRIGYSNSRWANPSLYLNRAMDYYSPKFQKRSFVNFVPWNTVQKSSRDLNSGVYSYESKGDGGFDSRGEPESKPNPVVDATKKTQGWKYNSQALPKSNKDQTVEQPGGYNQNYYVYYLGKNQDKNPLTSGIYTRGNPLNNYQQMRMAYPQFYDNTNRLQDKEKVMTTSNDDDNQKSMMFRIMYNVPSTRRKRQVGGNFFVPFKDTEDAIVTNTFFENGPRYIVPNTKTKNDTSFDSGVIDGEGSKRFENKRIDTNKKGEEHDKTGVGASDLKTYFTPVRPEGISESDRENSAPIMFPDNKKRLRHEYFDEERILHIEKNCPSKYSSRSSNSNTNKPTQQENKPKYSLQSLSGNSASNSRSMSPEDGSVKSRKILSSSTIHNVDVMQFQNVDNVTSSLAGTANDSVDTAVSKYVCQNENESIEYEDGDYGPGSKATTMKDSANQKHIEVIRSKPLRDTVKTSEELSNLSSNLKIPVVTREKSVSMEDMRDTKRAPIFDNQNRFDNFSSYPLGRVEIFGIDKNDLYVPNEEYFPAEWKRRKRGIGGQASQQEESVRKKRLDWFWPIKSSLSENAPHSEEYEQFEPNYASDSEKDSSERFGDNSDSNYDDLNVENEDYLRKKRQLQSIRPLSTGRNRRSYSNAGQSGRFGKYLPVYRERRYADGWYREPHRELLTDMTDVELFGALPQSYAGELNRYKRVKRDRRGRY